MSAWPIGVGHISSEVGNALAEGQTSKRYLYQSEAVPLCDPAHGKERGRHAADGERVRDDQSLTTAESTALTRERRPRGAARQRIEPLSRKRSECSIVYGSGLADENLLSNSDQVDVR